MRIYRQGDVLITEVNSIPNNKVVTKKVTLALGEATGHHHSITSGAVGFADDDNGLAEYVSVSDAAILEHQEHESITLPPGNYRINRQVEYTPQRLNAVRD